MKVCPLNWRMGEQGEDRKVKNQSAVRKHAEGRIHRSLWNSVEGKPPGLLQYGKTFLKAAKNVPVPEDRSFPAPRYYLICHGIELALKAVLALRGTAVPVLMDELRHNLAAALERAETYGIARKSTAPRPRIKIRSLSIRRSSCCSRACPIAQTWQSFWKQVTC